MESDEVTFHDFVRTWSPGLMRTAFLLTGDHGHAEDLLQTALMQVARRWKKLDNPGLAYGYARTALVNTHTSWRRRRRVPERLLSEHTEAQPPAHEHFAATDRTAAALQALPPGMRAVLVLRFHEDLSEADTARVLGCSVGNVKSQTSRALTRMRGFLAALPGEAPSPDLSATSRRRP